MPPWEEIHDRLLDRALELARRLEHLEAEVEHRRQLESDRGADEQTASPLLAELIGSVGQELEQARRTLHRIAAHAYGRCASCGADIGPDRLRVDPHALHCESCAPERESDALRRVRSQHVGMRVLLGSLADLMAALADDRREMSARGPEYAAALTLLGDLERELDRHFHLEEQGGYLAEALAAVPQHARRAAVLVREHERFRKEVAVLLERARLAGAAPGTWQGILADFGEFRDSLLEHEEAENEIIAAAWLDDRGGGA